MRISSAFLAFMLLMSVCGCSTISDKDLADLKGPNMVVQEEAIQRIVKGRSFPLSLIDPFVSGQKRKEAVDIVADLIVSGKEPKDIELKLVRCLGQLSKMTEIPVDILIDKLKDKDPQMLAVVVEALGKARNRKAIPALLKLMEEEKMPYSAIWAIGEIGDPVAIPSLDRLLASEDAYVRFNAYKALAKIGSGQVEDSSQTKIQGTLERRGPLEYLNMAFDKYQDAMSAIFQKIAGTKYRA
jgi:hypothetical protein